MTMIILTLSKCPSRLRGDVTKWLMEINTGVYVGKLSARVRDLLWKRVCEYCESGEATMVFSARNEQGFSFYIHNTTWKPTDYEGLVLIKRPMLIKKEDERKPKRIKSKENQKLVSQATSIKQKILETPVDITHLVVGEKMPYPLDFVAIDLETTGLKAEKDSIIEMGAIRYKQGKPIDQFHALVKLEKEIPESITQLTGIQSEYLERYGHTLEKALEAMLRFIKDDILVGHYISFDMLFLKTACSRLNYPFTKYRIIDTFTLAKELCKESVDNYRLETLVRKYDISECQEHRALPDASLAAKLYLKLNEN